MSRALFAPGIGLTLIRQPQQIVHADAVIGGKGDEDMGRDHPLTALIIGIGALRHIDRFAHLTLCLILILPQIADSLVFLHIHHHAQYMEEQFVLLTF